MIVETLFASSEKEKKRIDVSFEDGGNNFLTNLFGKSHNKKVREDNADSFDDIYACINILSDDIAKLPLKVYQNTDGVIKRVNRKEHNVAKLLSGRPNQYMSNSDYKKLIMVDVLINGNHYSYIRRNRLGKVVSIEPLPINATRPILNPNGELIYQTVKNGVIYFRFPEEIIHIKGFTRNGIHGKSPIRVIAERVESNQAANSYNKDLLEKGGAPKGILKVPGALAQEAKIKTKDEWKKVQGNDQIAVIDNGLEYQQMGMSQEDMQFIDSQKFNKQQIAAIYKVPLHKLNEMGRATYSNIENQSLEYVKNTLQPWITRIEEEFDTKLFNEMEQDRNFYTKFNLDSELRGDSETRAKVDKLQVETGSKTLNEIRARNEDSPYDTEFGDRPLVTLNWTFLDNLLDYQNTKAGVLSRLEKNEPKDSIFTKDMLGSVIEMLIEADKLKGGGTKDE